MKRFAIIFSFMIFITFLFPLLIAADESVKKPLTLSTDTFMEMETITNPAMSPDGKSIIFSRGWIDKVNDQSKSNLWIISLADRQARELTHENWRDYSPVWSPDGKKIAYLSERDGTTQIHVLRIDTGASTQLTHFDHAPAGLVWSPDGKRLAFTCRLKDEKPILPISLPPKPEGAKWAAPAVIIDRLGWRVDGTGFLPKGYTHIFIVDAEIGGTPKQITSGDYNHSDPQWSADGKTIYFSGIRKEDAEYLNQDSEIYSVDLDSLQVKILTDRKGPDQMPKVSPDGRWIAYTGHDDRNFTFHITDICLMDKNGGGKRLLAEHLASSPRLRDWAPDNSGIYFMMDDHGESHLCFVPLKGEWKKITRNHFYLSEASLARSGQAAAIVSTFQRPGYLVTFRLQKPEDMTELIDVNADILSGIKLSEAEELKFPSPDGLVLQGWLIKPAGLESGKKYPLVLWIHGGPWAMYNVGFNWGWQHMASKGYTVLYMNPRGSTGYGQDFVNGIQFSYPGKDFDDLMAGVDAVIAKGLIDPENLFVCGGSGGGCLTAWIVGHTGRFRAAVSMRPVINWHSFAGTTDFSDWYRQFTKYPWEDPMEYAKRSPLNYVANVSTPTMVMTGEADLRTPMGQSEEFYRALKMLKKETLLVRMPEEFHGWRRPSHRLAQELYLLAWFEKYRKK